MEILGLDEILSDLDKLVDPQKLERGLGKAAMIVERDAKKKAPKDSGELRRSISSEVQGKSAVVFTPLEYAPYVEYGTGLFAENGGRKDVPWSYQDDEGNWHSTSGQHPQPFLRPALQENKQRILDAIKGELFK